MSKIKLTFGMLAFSVLLTFTSCQKDDAIVPDMATTAYSESEYQLEDLDGLESPDVTAATEDADIKIRDTDRQRNPEHSLASVLKHLNLDESQRTAVKGFVAQQSACVAEHRSKVQERHQEILQKANAKREEFVKAYRAGRITKAELEERLTTLRERVKENLNKDEQKQVRIRIMRKCRAELMANIKSVLTREQLQKFNRWQQSLQQ